MVLFSTSFQYFCINHSWLYRLAETLFITKQFCKMYISNKYILVSQNLHYVPNFMFATTVGTLLICLHFFF